MLVIATSSPRCASRRDSTNALASTIPNNWHCMFSVRGRMAGQLEVMAFIGERTTKAFRLRLRISSGTIPGMARRINERR